MSEFDISDKELKSLLQADGLEQPSADFNNLLLEKIKKTEARKAQPVTAPKWLLILMGILFIAPSVYFVLSGQSILTEPGQFSLESIDLGISPKFVWIGVLALLILGITLLLNTLYKRPAGKSRVKKG